MKIILSSAGARAVLERLGDVQPGTDLDDVKRRIIQAMPDLVPQPSRLTAHEISAVINACNARLGDISLIGNPNTATQDVKGALTAAVAKLERLREKALEAAAGGE